ncbi:MAG: IS701 family transposase [Planctomycetota bacterium]|nr:IS701 family transposase [Planctomycetota bacterium]
MDAKQIRELRPRLKRFLGQFDDCFDRRDTREHFPTYVEGQLSDLPRKSVEPIALKSGTSVRTLQEFLSQHSWKHDQMRDRLQQLVAREYGGPHGVGLIDETSYVKKGDKTPGVQRQHCGAVGKKENCVVTVHLGFSREDSHCLLDGELYLPQSWSDDRERCRQAGIPDEMVYRPKTDIALELYDRASQNGVEFEWLTFDEGYGGKPPFLRALDTRDQRFVGEVPVNFRAWAKRPLVTTRTYRRGGRGRPRKTPRLVAGGPKLQKVADLLKRNRKLRQQPWQRWRVKDGEKGPMVWEVKHMLIYVPDADGLPGKTWHLLIARNPLDPTEIKYFVSNASPETTAEVLLLVAFSRWRIERCFEDDKGEIGLDHYEGRKYVGLKRHLILSAVSLLFLAQTREALREKKSGIDSVPDPHCRECGGAVLVA